ncbi:MAG: ABC transporter ATP-binding protein [Opitutales bacterium]|nr:ABC transporter ATP-binding protein [Opitutales bacterium]
MTERTEETVVALEGVHKTYGSGGSQVAALRGVDLTIRRGEMVAVMGPSGSGKSTLMNILGCLDRPGPGRYLLDGVDVGRLSRDKRADLRNRKLGFVFQDFHLLSRTSALENVEMPMLYNTDRISGRELRRRAEEALERVGLADRAGHHPNQLSGGQQQRVAIARALVNKPTFLLADEPTGNLDTRTSLDIMSLFQQLNADGLTVILVTHEPEMSRFCSRVVVLRDGLVERDGPMADRRSAKAMRAAFDREHPAGERRTEPVEVS